MLKQSRKMKKISLTLMLFGASLGLLTVQIFVLQAFVKKEEIEKSVDSTHELISKTVSISYKHNVPLFLADQRIFKYLENGSNPGFKNCAILCLGQKVTHLATVGPLSTQTQKKAFVEALEVEGLQVLEFTGSDPVLLQHGLNAPIPLHYVIYGEIGVIHLSVLYERPSKFWWIGAIQPSEKSVLHLDELGVKHEDLMLMKSPFALEKVEIQSAAVDKIKMFVPLQRDEFLDYHLKNRFIECNYSRAKDFHGRYGRDESDEAEIFRSKAWKLLHKAKTLLDGLGIPFWLSSGTCLGFYRECGFIPYSKDLDIGIWIKDFNPKLISTFSVHDLPLTHSFGKAEDSFELSFRDNDIKLDIFFFYEESNHVWNGGTQARTGKKFKYIFPKFQLCWTEFLELKVRIPCETLEYITANYGPNWFEPVKVWDWKKSPPNVVENGQWPVEEWPEVIQLLPLPEQT